MHYAHDVRFVTPNVPAAPPVDCLLSSHVACLIGVRLFRCRPFRTQRNQKFFFRGESVLNQGESFCRIPGWLLLTRAMFNVLFRQLCVAVPSSKLPSLKLRLQTE